MIRWHEKQGCYRVELTHEWETACLLVGGAGCVITAILITIFGGIHHLDARSKWLCVVVFVIFGVGAIALWRAIEGAQLNENLGASHEP